MEFQEYPKAVGAHLALNADHEAEIRAQYYPEPAADGDDVADAPKAPKAPKKKE